MKILEIVGRLVGGPGWRIAREIEAQGSARRLSGGDQPRRLQAFACGREGVEIPMSPNRFFQR